VHFFAPHCLTPFAPHRNLPLAHLYKSRGAFFCASLKNSFYRQKFATREWKLLVTHTHFFSFLKQNGSLNRMCPPVWAGQEHHPNPEGPRCLGNDGACTCPFPDSTCKMNRAGADGRMFWAKVSGTARQFEDSTSHEAIAYDTRRDGGDTVR